MFPHRKTGDLAGIWGAGASTPPSRSEREDGEGRKQLLQSYQGLEAIPAKGDRCSNGKGTPRQRRGVKIRQMWGLTTSWRMAKVVQKQRVSRNDQRLVVPRCHLSCKSPVALLLSGIVVCQMSVQTVVRCLRECLLLFSTIPKYVAFIEKMWDPNARLSSKALCF